MSFLFKLKVFLFLALWVAAGLGKITKREMVLQARADNRAKSARDKNYFCCFLCLGCLKVIAKGQVCKTRDLGTQAVYIKVLYVCPKQHLPVERTSLQMGDKKDSLSLKEQGCERVRHFFSQTEIVS